MVIFIFIHLLFTHIPIFLMSEKVLYISVCYFFIILSLKKMLLCTFEHKPDPTEFHSTHAGSGESCLRVQSCTEQN